MKNIYLFALSILTSSAIMAQAEWPIPEENTGMITKITATWCNPCGSWGWEAMEDVMSTYNDDNIVISLYAPASSELYNVAAEFMAEEIGYGGTPNFAGNGLDQETSVAAAQSVVDTFMSSAPVVATPAYEITNVTDSTILIDVYTKFFESLDGTFHLEPLFVENHVVEYQNGQGEDASHHNVLRSFFSPKNDSTFVIKTGSVEAGEVIKTKYVLERTPSWDLEESFIATTLWVENPMDPADLLYINGSRYPQAGELKKGKGTKDEPGEVYYDPSLWPIGMGEIDDIEFSIYPNPAKGQLNIKLSEATDFSIVLTDLLGKQVISESFTASSLKTLDVNDLPEGVYMIQVKTESQTYFDRVVIK